MKLSQIDGILDLNDCTCRRISEHHNSDSVENKVHSGRQKLSRYKHRFQILPLAE